jgi:ABC-type nitrate/sulfonate/bicarbonate transport system ATPase subunit
MRFSFAAKSFGEKQILQPVSISLEDSKVTALLGPSGVGKTTLLRLVAGLDADDSGKRQSAHRIGFLFQEPRLIPWLTVRENIELVAAQDGWLTRIGLAGTENLYPRQLSLGMARRVALARALAFKPDLLVLDEPFASLDGETAMQVKDLLRKTFRDAPVTTLLVTHDEKDLSDLATQAFRLQGRPAQLNRA